MYEAYWGLSEAPFAQTADPRFYYMGHLHEDVLMMLHYGLTRNKGAILLTGPLGAGKTILCCKLLGLLDPTKTLTVTIANPALDPLQLQKEMLSELGFKTASNNRQTVAEELQKRLLDVHKKGKRVLLFLDDAHLITEDGAFEELNKLLNLRMDDQFLASLCLCGQSAVNQSLTKFPELDQMIPVRERLRPLSLVESGEMLMHRLRTAGYAGDPTIFDADALIELHRFTQGAPRLICHIANHALTLGKLQKARFIDGMIMHSTIDEFYGEDEEAA